MQGIKRTSFVFIPGKVEIEFNAGVFPVAVSWLCEHQRHVRKLCEWSAHHESSWIILPKSTCTNWKMELDFDVRVVTDGCDCFGSSPWCSWKVYGSLEQQLIKPNLKFDSYGSFEVLENMKMISDFYLFSVWF